MWTPCTPSGSAHAHAILVLSAYVQKYPINAHAEVLSILRSKWSSSTFKRCVCETRKLAGVRNPELSLLDIISSVDSDQIAQVQSEIRLIWVYTDKKQICMCWLNNYH